jgi:hypothetical protein
VPAVREVSFRASASENTGMNYVNILCLYILQTFQRYARIFSCCHVFHPTSVFAHPTLDPSTVTDFIAFFFFFWLSPKSGVIKNAGLLQHEVVSCSVLRHSFETSEGLNQRRSLTSQKSKSLPICLGLGYILCSLL